MTTATERKARREERLRKEELREKMLLGIWTMLKYLGAGIGTGAAAMWLAVVMWDHVEWALTISWVVASVGIGAALFREAEK